MLFSIVAAPIYIPTNSVGGLTGIFWFNIIYKNSQSADCSFLTLVSCSRDTLKNTHQSKNRQDLNRHYVEDNVPLASKYTNSSTSQVTSEFVIKLPAWQPRRPSGTSPNRAGGSHANDISDESILGQLSPARTRGPSLSILHLHWEYSGPSLEPSDTGKNCISCRLGSKGGKTAPGEITDTMQKTFPDHPSWRLNSFFMRGGLDNGIAEQRQRFPKSFLLGQL